MSFESWDLFANYESYELIKRAYEKRHEHNLETADAQEIAAYFIHAHSYFDAGKSGAQTVRPLLLYYGVLSLARGLVRFLTKNRQGTDFSPSHGLRIVPQDEALRGDTPDFSALRAKVIKKGTFLELGEATGFRSLLRKKSAGVDFKICNSPVPQDIEFNLGDILSRTPALCDSFENWKGDHLCVICGDIESDDDRISIHVAKSSNPNIARDRAERIFRDTKFLLEKETEKHLIFGGPNKVDEAPGFADKIIKSFLSIGQLWITSPYSHGIRLSKISTLFALSYLMGMLVRYYPVQWTALIRGLIPDAALPALSKAVDLIEEEFPQAIADFLREPVTSA